LDFSMEGTTTSGSPRSGESPRSDASGRVPSAVVGAIDAHLRHRELRREELHQRARLLRRLAQATMTHLHDGQPVDGELAEVRRATVALAEWVRSEGRGDEAVAHDAFQEGVEALLLGAVVRGEVLPGPVELGVDPEVYLLGLGDLAGEVRRLVLGRLDAADLAGADRYLGLLEDLYRTLMRFDTTRAIVQLKPKQDVARALLERTRGEVTLARLLARARLPPGGVDPP